MFDKKVKIIERFVDKINAIKGKLVGIALENKIKIMNNPTSRKSKVFFCKSNCNRNKAYIQSPPYVNYLFTSIV